MGGARAEAEMAAPQNGGSYEQERMRALQDGIERIQKLAFTKWMNSFLNTVIGKDEGVDTRILIDTDFFLFLFCRGRVTGRVPSIGPTGYSRD